MKIELNLHEFALLFIKSVVVADKEPKQNEEAIARLASIRTLQNVIREINVLEDRWKNECNKSKIEATKRDFVERGIAMRIIKINVSNMLEKELIDEQA